jgi:DNA polymerase III alpha subunit
MRVAALTCRSYYSLLRGSVSVQRWVAKAGQCGYGAIALADVNSLYGAVDFYKAAGQANIKPILGVEILTDSQRAILLAEDRAGYKNLCRITTARNLRPRFDLIEQLKGDNEGVICISNQPELLYELKECLDKDHLFAGCHEPYQVELAKAWAIEPLACTTFNIIDSDDIVTAKLLAKIRQLSGAGSGPGDNCGFNTLVSQQQLRQKFRDYPQAIGHAEEIAQRCNLQLLNGKYLHSAGIFLDRSMVPEENILLN